jgi:uncharacterized protein (DUF1684 family)
MNALRLALATLPALLAAVPVPLAAQDAAYAAEVAKWRTQREDRLKADGGWLTVTGLFWLHEGSNPFGSAPTNEITLPSGTPGRAGVFELRQSRVTVRLQPGVAGAIGGQPLVGPRPMADDGGGSPDVLTLGRTTMHVIARGGRFGIRLKDLDSAARREFKGLTWYPVDSTYRVTAKFVPYAPPRPISVPNILGEIEEMRSPGYALFTLGGKEVKLEPVLEAADARELFFIFRDQTSGKETYPGGRFLYSALPQNGTVVLDFNKAYNPPCAFTRYATCPLPPKGNRLEARIDAGEKTYGDH